MTRLSDIFDQPHAIDAIRRAYSADRLPHGLIFAGPAGVGKATTAAALATVFLCEAPKGADACGTCAACRLMAAGNHPDYHVITRQLVKLINKDRAASTLSVDVIRQFLLEPASHKSAMSRGKVFVVEEADYMNAEAQNSMLKTLEEPAGRTLIVLLSEQPDCLLATIRSRCQIVRFGLLPEARVQSELQKRGIAAAVATAAARYTEGSLGVALQWIEEGVIEHARTLENNIDALIGGRVLSDPAGWFAAAVEDYHERLAKRKKADTSEEDDGDEKGRPAKRDVTKTQITREVLGRYLRIASGVFRRHLRQTEREDLREPICAAIDAIAEAERYLDANVTISLIFQQFAVRLEGLFVKR